MVIVWLKPQACKPEAGKTGGQEALFVRRTNAPANPPASFTPGTRRFGERSHLEHTGETYALAKRERSATSRRPRENTLARPLFLLSLVCIAQLVFLTSSLFRLHTIKVTGIKVLTRRDVLKAAQLRDNELLYKIPLHEVESRVKKLHWVSEVAVRRSLPSQITIRISERNPVLAVRASEESTPGAENLAAEFPDHWFVVSSDGVVLTRAEAGLHDRLPRCCLPKDMDIGQALPPQQVNNVLSVRKALPSQLEAQVLELRADPEDQFELVYRLFGKPTVVRIGTAEQIKEKFLRLEHLLGELRPGEAHPTYIDLRFEEPAVGYPAQKPLKGKGVPGKPGASPSPATNPTPARQPEGKRP